MWRLPKALQVTTRFVDEHVFEERLERMDVYEVLWEVSDITDMATHEPPPELRPVHTSLKVVAGGVNKVFTKDHGLILITHYQRLLNYIQQHFVHVFNNGKIIKSGGKELALELEAQGYDWLTTAAK